MLSKTSIDRVAGGLLLAFLVAFVVAFTAGPDLDTRQEEFSETLQEIADDEALWLKTGAFLMVASLVAIGLAGALYQAFRPHERALALFGALGFVAFSLALMMSFIGGTALNEMAQEFASASGVQASVVVTSARPVALITEFALVTGFAAFLPVSLLVFGALITRIGVVPRLLGWLAVASGVLIPFFWLSSLIDNIWFVGFIGSLGGLLWFLITGFWMLLKGTREATAA